MVLHVGGYEVGDGGRGEVGCYGRGERDGGEDCEGAGGELDLLPLGGV